MKKKFMVLSFSLLQLLGWGQNVTGDWSGHLKVQGVQVKIVFHIRQDSGKFSSTFDSPDQNAMGLPVDETVISDTLVTMNAKSFGILYQGHPSEKNDTISGNWQQGGMKFPLILTKEIIQPAVLPADPDESEVVLSTPSGDIKGTLLMPRETEKVPVMLIIAGSGPTDRDGNSPPALKNNSNCYKLLAQEMKKNGIASLRYDKRGVGGSILAGIREKDLRFDNYVEDAIGWILLLSKDNRFSKIIVAGHSEGSLIGMIGCEGEAVSGFVSISGAGRPADAILREQLKDMPENDKKTVFAVIGKLKAGDTTSLVPADARQMFRPSVQPYLISWFRYDPALEISKLKVPVLIVQGEMDIQVSVSDAEILAKANPGAELKLIRRMNHVLKDTDTRDKMEQVNTVYMNPELPLDTEFTSDLVNFIRKVK